MSSRPAKNFPSGAFLPNYQRFMAIGQLCLAFSLMLWYLVQPFMGEYFTVRSRMLLYEYVMGTSEILKARMGQEIKLEKQQKRFQQLSLSDQQRLREDYQQLQSYAKRSALKKLGDGLRTLIQDIPPFEQAWIFFSVIIAILLLLKKEGAKQAVWLLPMLVVAYAIDNQLTGKSPLIPPDYSLFPSEETIIQHYITEPFASTPFEQKAQLEKGWEFYLLENWFDSLTDPASDALEEAGFNFTVARLKLLHGQSRSDWLHHFHQKSGPLLLGIYLLWNGLFAWMMSRSPRMPKQEECQSHLSQMRRLKSNA